MNIRSMKSEDIEEVYQIEKKSFSVPWSKEAFEKSLEDKFQNFYVACEDDRILGYCGTLTVCGETDITNIAVDAEFKRKKIGEKLLAHVIAVSKENQDSVIFLEVRTSNNPARKLYEKAGFTIYGERKNFYDFPKEDAILMKLELVITKKLQ